LKPILEIKGIGKKYRIRSNIKPYLSLRETISGLLKPSAKHEDFWALKDISFDVLPGDTVGIIGKNGAGKSTLLKILSKITPPTRGKIISRGRIASLLEVGTGFHPELSGRENIYLNGSILGMKKAEIKKQFDAILDFSGVEKFIETPLKHYSSGMQLRLAFAVAAFLEPEVLIIDEVLAVGDAEFQKKCLGKMEDVSRSGRTILFVSHNLASLQVICKKGILLNKGISSGIFPIEEVVREYIHGTDGSSPSIFIAQNPLTSKDAFITGAVLKDKKSEVCKRFKVYEDIIIEINWTNSASVRANANFMLVNGNSQTVMVALDTTSDWNGDKKSKKGKYISRFRIPKNLLNVGEYMVNIALDCSSPAMCYDFYISALTFTVWDPMDENSIARGGFSIIREDAVLMPALETEFEYSEGI
jgi:lipopolysaccharide transport system ATP-binding protein